MGSSSRPTLCLLTAVPLKLRPSRFRPPDLYAAPFVCGDLLRLQSDRSVWLLEPCTGAVVLRAEDPRVRPALLPSRLLVTGFGVQLTLYETPSGRCLCSGNPWRIIDPSVHGPRVVIARSTGTGRAVLALMDVGDRHDPPAGSDLPLYGRKPVCRRGGAPGV